MYTFKFRESNKSRRKGHELRKLKVRRTINRHIARAEHTLARRKVA